MEMSSTRNIPIIAFSKCPFISMQKRALNRVENLPDLNVYDLLKEVDFSIVSIT